MTDDNVRFAAMVKGHLLTALSLEVGDGTRRALREVLDIVLSYPDPPSGDLGFRKGQPVVVRSMRSAEYGMRGSVWFVKDGRVMVSFANPSSISGQKSFLFDPAHLDLCDDESPLSQGEERKLLLSVLRENVEMSENLSSTQARCGVLLEATRAMRRKIMELGGEDPGSP